MFYEKNRLRAKTRNTSPSETDQSSARDTDINVIVGRFVKTGMAPAAKNQPMAGDFSNLPTDLAGFINTAKTMKYLRNKLPPQLQDMKIEEIMALTPEQLTAKLTPPKEEDKKE